MAGQGAALVIGAKTRFVGLKYNRIRSNTPNAQVATMDERLRAAKLEARIRILEESLEVALECYRALHGEAAHVCARVEGAGADALYDVLDDTGREVAQIEVRLLEGADECDAQ